MGSRVVHENRVHAWFLAGGVADDTLAEVEEAELAAAVGPLRLTVDGLNMAPNNNNASIAMMTSGKIAQRPGTRQLDITLRFAREEDPGDDPDVAWNLFEHGLSGDLIISRFTDEPSVGDPLEVIRGESHDPSPIASAQDTYQQFEVSFPADDWELKSELVEDDE